MRAKVAAFRRFAGDSFGLARDPALRLAGLEVARRQYVAERTPENLRRWLDGLRTEFHRGTTLTAFQSYTESLALPCEPADEDLSKRQRLLVTRIKLSVLESALRSTHPTPEQLLAAVLDGWVDEPDEEHKGPVQAELRRPDGRAA